jgi:replicative DNA helicase
VTDPQPHNLDAERAVLGVVLADSAQFTRVSALLSWDDFHLERHKRVWGAMEDIHRLGGIIDTVTVANRLKDKGQLDVVELPYISGLDGGLGSIFGSEHYCRIVKEDSIRRRAIAISQKLIGELQSGGNSVETLASAERLIRDLGAETATDRRLKTVGEVIVEQGGIDAFLSRGKEPGIMTRHPQLNYILGGAKRQQLIILAARPSVGKAQPLYSQVLTPRGFVCMGSISVGDKVIGSDGKAHSVTGVFDRGVLPIYRVRTSDGRETECCGEHLWLTRSQNEKKHHDGCWSVKSTDQIRSTLRYTDADQRLNHSLPVVAPVEFDGTGDLPIHPYLLGVWLGDGTCGSSRMIRIHKPEPDIHGRCAALLPPEDELIMENGGSRIKRRKRNNGPSGTLAALDAMALSGLRSWEKFIPIRYRLAPISDRLELLRGLLDTDGSVVGHGGVVEYGTSSPDLARDVAEVARSLGAIVTTAERIPSYSYKGEKRQGRNSWRLVIKFTNGIVPVLSSKHTARFKAGTRRTTQVRIEEITPAGEAECRCIAVDSSDHLYVTDDFLVTHNTAEALDMAEYAASNGTVTAVYSLEMNEDELIGRMACGRAYVDGMKWQRGQMDPDEAKRHRRAVFELTQLPLWIDSTACCTVPAIHASLRRLMASEPVGLVIVDYLQLLQPVGRYGNRTEAVSAMSRELKLAAKEFNIPFVVLSQLTRANERESRRPQLSDLRESGSIEQDANVVIFIHQESQAFDEVRPCEFIVAKNRNGQRGKVHMNFISRYARFEEATAAEEAA